MATSYSISIGYVSGYGFQGDADERWRVLVDAVQNIREDYRAILREVSRIEPQDLQPLMDYAKAYASEREDLTLRIVDTEINGERCRYIAQCASGDRTEKEVVRRAFCRLVIDAMHARGVEVNLNVT